MKNNLDYRGVIIEESLEDKSVLQDVEILETEVEQITNKHKTPWLKKWTLHTVIIPETKVQDVAKKISQSIDRTHAGAWYADFRNKTHHYIVSRDKIFYIGRASKEQYDTAKEYGISLGISPYQVDFHPGVARWEK